MDDSIIQHWAEECFIGLRDNGATWDKVTGSSAEEWEEGCKEIVAGMMRECITDLEQK